MSDDDLGCSGGAGGVDERFDLVVSALEEIVLGGVGSEGGLQAELEAWCRSRCGAFANAPAAPSGGGVQEFPLAWTAFFEEYKALVEKRIEEGLASRLDPVCSFGELETLLTSHADELSGEVFDVLMSLGEFSEFVSLMRSYTAQVAWETGTAAVRVGMGAAAAGTPACVAGLAPVVTKVAR